MIDQILRQSVLNELQREPSIDATDIDVVARDGEAILNGRVKYYAEKLNATFSARKVLGVTLITNNIAVQPVVDSRLTDADITNHARNVLAWDAFVPHGSINLKVEGGWITLSGDVEWEFQKQSVEADISNLVGITGVTNDIVIATMAQTLNLGGEIKAAFDKNPQFADSDIEVSIEGSKVTLCGEVDSHYSRALAENVAVSTSSITHAEDLLTVS